LAFVRPKNLKNLGRISIVTSTNFATNLLRAVTKVLISQNLKQNTYQHQGFFIWPNFALLQNLRKEVKPFKGFFGNFFTKFTIVGGKG
jgi:hypothetical protein